MPAHGKKRAMIKAIYLDNHSICRPFPSAIERMLPFFKDQWRFPDISQRMEQEILEYFGAGPLDRMYFFSNGPEAASQVFFSTYMNVVRQTGRNHVLTASIEAAAVLHSFQQFEQLDCFCKALPVNHQGQLTKEILEEAIGPRTALVSFSWASALTGVVHPLADLVQTCKEKGVLVHVDATYAIGKLYFRFQDLDVDFLTFDGGSLQTPLGTGGIIVKSGVDFSPFAASLSPNIPALAALCASIEKVDENFDHVCTETARLRDKFEQGIKQGFPEAVILFENAERLPNCCAIGFPGASHEALLYLLHRQGIYATAGESKFQQLSQMLKDCGVDPFLAESALSFSLSYETTEEEIDHAVEAIVSSAQKLKTVSCKIMEGIS
jgi:cysteine desulfurase